jgi:molecular chaperone GrpE
MSDVESAPVDSSQQEADINTYPEREEEETTPEAAAEQLQEVEEVEYEVIEGEVEEEEEETQEDEIETLRAELEQAQAQAAEYLDGWQRARAEFANFKKRVEAERQELRRASTEALLLKLLPVVDDFERAFQTFPEESSADEAWVDGFRMIFRKLEALLESEDVTPIEAAGHPFDPLWHQALLQEETDEHRDGYVIEEMQRGYRLGDRVLRPSMVKVASNSHESDDESEANNEQGS